MRQSKFGKSPSGGRLERIKNSPNYKAGRFQNLSNTPAFAEGYSVGRILYEKIFKKFPALRPIQRIPSVKTDLHHLSPVKDVLIWFGHSSYLMQIDGLRILVDPVFSGNASPIAGTNKSFQGSDIYTVSDLPQIDYLLISHDHYDHLDFDTLKALKGKVTKIICGLGVGAHLEHWGYNAELIIEKDWNEQVALSNNVMIYTESARHFSGRKFARNNTLWLSFVLKSPTKTVYLGGDSGYDRHYVDIGNKYGPFDLIILENGQYNKAWPYIHHTPEEVLKAARDLKAKRILPVHSGKFSLSAHPWDEPLKRLTDLNGESDISLLTPIIGEVVDLEAEDQIFERWWEGMK